MAEAQEPYPEGVVVGPCICGSWPGGKCLKCPRTAPLTRITWDERGVRTVNGIPDDAPQQQAELVAWDKPSASFNEWWDSDRHDNANPFEKDSYAYWAWEGWQAALAQRPWVGLTDEDIKTTWSQLYCDVNHMKFAPEDRPQKETVGFLFARAIEAKLKERNI